MAANDLPPFAARHGSEAALPQAIPLWPDGAPGAPASAGSESTDERGTGYFDRIVRNVHVPAVTPYLPASTAGGRTAVVVCPGGGYRGLAIDKEGHDMARWFNSFGVAAFVLKYRLPRPDGGPVYGQRAPLQDVQRALRLVRSRATEWAIDPERVGVLGFSAGGHLAASAGTLFRVETEPDRRLQRIRCRPDFMVLVYPVITLVVDGVFHRGCRDALLGPDPTPELLDLHSCERQVTRETPPAFLVQTGDDSVNVMNSVLFYQALQRAGVPAEMHLFARGGHGYGMRQTGLPVCTWPQRCREWLERLC